MKKYERVKALVSLDAIAHNFEEMYKNVKEGTKIIAVIKADGYGHGARVDSLQAFSAGQPAETRLAQEQHHGCTRYYDNSCNNI